MAIQVRRGLYKDFDPAKMLPGEWAVSIDAETQNQVVWMCFSAGVVKRMGTYEDFVQQVTDATVDVKDEYMTEFNTVLDSIRDDVSSVSADKEIVLQVKSDIFEDYIPQIETLALSAEQSALASANSAVEAQDIVDNIAVSATVAESYAVGGTGTRENEDVDNAKYYKNQAERISQGLSGALLPMGTITFTQLASQTKQPGYMFNISDAFTTDATFKEGAGFSYPEGTNVYYTADGYWDCLAGTAVIGVKGSAESVYRTGSVNITNADIGAAPISHASEDTTYGVATANEYGHVKVDVELSDTSENPVQNKAVKVAVDDINSNLTKTNGTVTAPKFGGLDYLLYQRGDVAHIRFFGITTEAINAGTTAFTVDVLPTKSVRQIPTLMTNAGVLSGTVVTIGTNGNCSFSANLISGIYVSFDFEYEA